MSRAYVFPGQGAQTIGMGRALAEAYPAARAVFDEVDAALGEKLSALIWEGDIAELTLTQNAQPALMATSIAALRALEVEGLGLDHAQFVAGHSLGEYSALCAAGARVQFFDESWIGILGAKISSVRTEDFVSPDGRSSCTISASSDAFRASSFSMDSMRDTRPRGRMRSACSTASTASLALI